jgi:hypothetical protein
VFSYDHEELDRLAAQAPARQSASKYKWTKESVYTLYEGSKPLATLTEDREGKMYIDLGDDQYTVEAWTDDMNYQKPRTVFSVFYEGNRITKPARHQLLTAVYRAYIGESDDSDDETESDD